MDNKLIQFLQMATESSPVWLDNGNTIAYIRHDNTGSHIWQMDLTTGEKLCRTTEDTRIWTIKSVPATGDIYYAPGANVNDYIACRPDKQMAQRLQGIRIQDTFSAG